MLLTQFDSRLSRLLRLVGLAFVVWSVVSASDHPPGTSGRGLVVLVLLIACVLAWLGWLASARTFDLDARLTPDLYVLAVGGGVLLGASPSSAAAAFVFVGVVSAAIRAPLARAWTVFAAGALASAITVLVWDGRALGLLAYVLGYGFAMFAASNARQFRERAAQAELLLAQTQRSQEERLRAARLEESTRIAREIHDVLAHALAGLTIQLEATAALIENGAEPARVLERVRRGHELARDGLRETRRAVGALRGDEPSIPDTLGALAAGQSAALVIDGDRARLRGDVGLAVLRVVQESLTNVAKHAPGAEPTVAVEIGTEISVTVENALTGVPVAAGGLAASGGGYGIAGMRERAEALGGTLDAGPVGGGWRVHLRVPDAGGDGDG